MVAVIALAVRLSNEDAAHTSSLENPLMLTLTGSTNQLTSAEYSNGPAVAPAGGRIQPSQGTWEALLPRLEEMVEADPDDVNALRKLALAYYNLGRLEKAAAIYEELLAAQEDPVLRNRLGNTLRDMGDLAGAEAAYRRAIADDPTIAPHYVNLAELLWREGRSSEALAVIDQGLQAVPEESRLLLEQARAVLEEAERAD